MPAILPRVLLEHLLRGLEVVERHDPQQLGEHLGDAAGLRHHVRVLARAHVGGVGRHREHQRVVVAVVGALDLDDEVAAGVGAHQAGAFQGGLGARVAEAPQRQLEALGEVLADHVEVLRGLGEVGAQRRLLLDRLHDLRVRVAHHHGAVAQVEVDVLVLVDVPQVVALAAVDEDRVRRRVLPAGGDAAGDVAVRDLAIGDRGLPLGLELGLFALDQRVDPVEIELDGVLDSHACRLLGRRSRIRVGLNGRSMMPHGGVARQALGTADPGSVGGEPLVSWSTQHGGCSSARLERLVVVQEAAGSNPVTHPKTRRPGRWKARLVNCAGPLAQFGRATDS